MRTDDDIRNCKINGIPKEEMIRLWDKEIAEAVETMDVPTFRKFYKKWTELGIYNKDITPTLSDKILEISIRKIAVHLTNISQKTRDEAAAWLTERGYEVNWKI